MSLVDKALILFVAPWMALGFLAALTLAFLLDVQGAIAALCLGVIAPALTYFLPRDLPLDDAGLVDLLHHMLRAPAPFELNTTGNIALLELTMDWWVGAALGAALGIYVRRRPA